MARIRPGRRRIFTIEEANAALPLVRAIVADLSELSREVIDRRRRLSALLEGRDPDPTDPYYQELVHIRQELDKDSRRVLEYAEELRALGIEPQAGSEGLVHFPAVIDKRKVYLCWKLGEPEVLYWHEMNAGFRDRRPLAAGSVAEEHPSGEEGLGPQG